MWYKVGTFGSFLLRVGFRQQEGPLSVSPISAFLYRFTLYLHKTRQAEKFLHPSSNLGAD